MTAGSLIQIAASGEEDCFLVGNPEVTLFKTLHKHHTNFSRELKEYKIDNVGLNQDLKFVIPRDGDLLHKIYLKIKATKYFDTKKKYVYVNFNENNFINYIDFFHNSYNYGILLNDNPKTDLLIYKNIDDSENGLIYSNIELIDNKIFIEEIHTDNIDNVNFIYITKKNIKYNFNAWRFELYLNDLIIESSGLEFNDILEREIYNFNNILSSSEDYYKIIIEDINISNIKEKEFNVINKYEYSFKIYEKINYNFYTLYPDYNYKFLYNKISNLSIGDIEYNLVDLKYKLENDKLEFENILVENEKKQISLDNIEIYNYSNITKVLFSTIEEHNLEINDYILVSDLNNVLNTPFNKNYKIDEIINENEFLIIIDNLYKFYSINNINNLSTSYYPNINFIENNYDIYIILSREHYISVLEIITYIYENSKISKIDIYGSNIESSVTQYNIDNKIEDNWIFIESIIINEYKNINDKIYYDLNYNYYKYYKISLFYTEDSSIYSFKLINLYENKNIDISNNLIIFENDLNNNIFNTNKSLYTNFNLRIDKISLYNIILQPEIINNNEIIKNINTTSDGNGYGLILEIEINNKKIINIIVKEGGYNYNYDDIIYINKIYFENSINDLIIKLDKNNFVNIDENINKYKILDSISWVPNYSDNHSYYQNNLNKILYITLNEKILPSYISFNGAKNKDEYINLFNFYGLIWRINNYNSKIINYSLDINETNSLFTLENFKSNVHNSHSSNTLCNSIIIDEEHSSIVHSEFIHFDINNININSKSNLFIYDYNTSYKNININDEYSSDIIINKLNSKLNSVNFNNYEFNIDDISNKLIFKKTNFSLKIINNSNLLYYIGFSSNNIYYQHVSITGNSGFFNSNFYLSDFEIPFNNIEITDNNNSFKLNDKEIIINSSIYTPLELIIQIENKIQDNDYEVIYFYNKFCIKKKNFMILNYDINSYFKFNNNIKNVNIIINNSNNNLSYNIGSEIENRFIKNNYYNLNELINEISNIIKPINIKINNDKIEVYDINYFNLENINNNILDTLGFYINSAVFSYIRNELYIINSGKNYKINDIIKIINPNNNDDIIIGKTIEINNNKSLKKIEIISREGKWNISSNKLLIDYNKSAYDIKYINNYYTITSNIISFIYINERNNKLYIKNNDNVLEPDTLIIPNDNYTPLKLKNIIQNILYNNSYDIIFDIEENKYIFINNSYINFTILSFSPDDWKYTNNVIPTLGFRSSINLVSLNSKIYSNIFSNYVNNNSYYSDISINSILDSDIKNNIQNKLGNDFNIKYENNKYTISKTNFSLYHNNYNGFFDKFSFNTSETYEDYYLNNNDCFYVSSTIIINIDEEIYFNNKNNIIFINNLSKIDNLLFNSNIKIKLDNYYENFNKLKLYINSKLIHYDINFGYSESEQQIFFRKYNFNIVSKNDILPTLGIISSFNSMNSYLLEDDSVKYISDNPPIRNNKILILKNGILKHNKNDTNTFNQGDILKNDGNDDQGVPTVIECEVLSYYYRGNYDNRLELEIKGAFLKTNLKFENNFYKSEETEKIYEILYSSIKTQNAISIHNSNTTFYYSYPKFLYSQNFISTSYKIDNGNYTIEEIVNELRKISSNFSVNELSSGKIQFIYSFGSVNTHFKLNLQNDLLKIIKFDYSDLDSENNKFISQTFSHTINITPYQSQLFIKENYENEELLIVNLYNYLYNNFINISNSNNVTLKYYNDENDENRITFNNNNSEFILSNKSLCFHLTNNLNKISKHTYNISFSNNKFIFKKENFKIFLYENNLLNIIPFDNKYNNKSFKSNLLTNTNYTIDSSNNTLIYYSSNTKNIKIPNGTYNILNFTHIFNQLLNYNYLLTYSNNIFTIKKSIFNIKHISNSILSTLNFNGNYNNNNIYYSDSYYSNSVNITNNNIIVLQDFDNKNLSGSVVLLENEYKIIGIGTYFLSELKKNDYIYIDDTIYQIDIISTDTLLYVTNIISKSYNGIYYYLMKNYTIVCDSKTYNINDFIIYFDNLINQHFIDSSNNNKKFEFYYSNNKFIIKKTDFSIINNSNILPHIGFTNTELSILNSNNKYYIESNILSSNINISSNTNRLSLTLYPIYIYNLYFTNNIYMNTKFTNLAELIQEKLNSKSIFYNVTYNSTTNKFTISNYKYNFKLIKTSFIELLGFNIDSQTEYDFSNKFISNSITGNISIDNFNNKLIIEEKKEINHIIYFPNNILIYSDFLHIFKNKLKNIDNGFDIELITEKQDESSSSDSDDDEYTYKFRITNNIKFKFNFISNFIYNFNNNINDILFKKFNYLSNEIVINEYNNTFSYQDTLCSYISIPNNNYSLNQISCEFTNNIYFSKYFHIYTNNTNTYLYIEKIYFNFIFNNPNNTFNSLGYNYDNTNINKLHYVSKTIPLTHTLITQNHSTQFITTSIINNSNKFIDIITLSTIVDNINLHQTILLQSQNNSNIKYYVTIIDRSIINITINKKIPNIIYELYSVNNLLKLDDWFNNSFITKQFNINTNNLNKYSYYKFEIISTYSKTNNYNGSISDFHFNKNIQINFTHNNIKYYTGINCLLEENNKFLTTKKLNYDFINITLYNSIIPENLYIDYINIINFKLYAFSNSFDETGELLTITPNINNKIYKIQHNSNSYKYYKLEFYYNTIPQIYFLELYKFKITNNIIYNEDYIHINTKLIDNNEYYITSINNKLISLPIKKSYKKFHYNFTSNFDNIFVSTEILNPTNYISYNNIITNNMILDNYDNYDKLYYYKKKLYLNNIFTILENQIIYINDTEIILQSGKFTIIELLKYLNNCFKTLNIKFSFNYITSQLSIYSSNNINNINFRLYNKYIINNNENEVPSIIIYNNKCIITFKNIHNYNENDLIYIYSPNISFLNNIFSVIYINAYIIQFNIMQTNKYIFDYEIKVFKYSNSFLDSFNIIPTINNNFKNNYISEIIDDINHDGIINCIDISLSDVYNIINNVSFHIGNTKIDSHSLKWNDIYNELLNPNQHYCNAMTQSKKINESNTYYIPLHFWFNNNYELALPLISLQYHEIFLEIKTNSYFGFKTNITNDSIEEFNILLDFIFLEDKERKLFASSDIEYLITYINKIEKLPINNNYNHIQLKSFENPVKSIFFYLNNCKLLNANIQFNDKLRTDNHNEIYYRIIQKYENNINKDLKIDYNLNNKRQWRQFIDDNSQNKYDSYMYSFCINLKDNINPSGSINFSQFKESYLILNLQEVERDSNIDIYAITYNILVIKNGMGGLKYTKG
jgi:hypothetical protein